ncbi:glutathione S-transferase [Colletotrichum orchidophilum]|uniref:Glutathione S-transferase n=1 Tax=Colletotrichum orchidophilum TaxID=1209926 RepID=A0A1G4BJE5_9PEZI|nr:glutathione S-transferase [Colletotrichum orchidophilum]OHF01551.1 glutathione S-transferase [Colletotrichum orchidophilum]
MARNDCGADDELGWRFATPDDTEIDGENVIPDPNGTFKYLKELYFACDPNYAGRITVPVLFDKKTKTIVNNESSDILRMFGTEFDDLVDGEYRKVTLYPDDLQAQIDEAHGWHFDTINSGVYRSGFATTQEGYNDAVTTLFESLDKVEAHLASVKSGPYYFGEILTEVDVRLYVTIIRFDPAYAQHFKCNIRDIRSGYPLIHRWLRRLYWNNAAFRDTTNFLHIKYHYTKSHAQINPFGVTPIGPLPNILPLEQEVAAAEAAGHGGRK